MGYDSFSLMGHISLWSMLMMWIHWAKT